MPIYYTKDHEWLRVEGDTGTVGISDHAQMQLGDVVFVELPEVGRQVEQGQAVAVVESVKAASEVYAPVSGKVVEVNQAIVEEPATVNEDAEGEAWFYKLRLTSTSEVEGLMDRDAYESYLETIS